MSAKAALLLTAKDRSVNPGWTTTTIQGCGQKKYKVERHQKAWLAVQSTG